VLIADVLAATSNSDDTTFSIPILVAAAAVGVGWVLFLVAVAAWRRPHGIRSGPATQDLPPVPPAVAGLLCNDFELPAELPPATLLDLAARHVIRLEEVEPSKTICRLRGTAGNEPLTPWRDLYDAHSQGETVGARYTANLGYVRELRPPAATPAT
jgi:hypothetical protein